MSGSQNTDKVDAHKTKRQLIGELRSHRRQLNAAKRGASRTDTETIEESLQARLDQVSHEYKLLSQIIDVAADAIISIDHNQNIVSFNLGAQHIFGYGTKETIGRTIDVLLPEKFRSGHGGHIRSFEQSKSTSRWMDRRGEIVGRRKDGTIFPARATIAKVTHDGTTIMTVFLRDISEIKQATKRIDDARNELAHAGRVNMLGEISASLAHELNQPLTAILANAQVLEKYVAEPSGNSDETIEVVSDIAADAARAADIVRRVRTLLERRKWQVELVDINSLVEDTLYFLQSELLIQRLNVETKLDPELPMVSCDRIQLQQVILNLLTNAIDATAGQESADRNIQVSTSVRKSKSVEMAVKDSGIGLVGYTFQEIVRPYFTTKENGLGMGLSISRSILEKFGGSLSATNNRDGGATFRVTLPTPTPTPTPTPEHAHESATSSGELESVHREERIQESSKEGVVFIVDDDESIRVSLSRIVRSAGYQVESYASAEEFEQRENYAGVGCILVDLHMPGASGLELQSNIRSRKCNLSVIVITGCGDTESSVRAMKGGATDFLTKPIDGDQLLTTIAHATSKSHEAFEQERLVLMARSLVERLTPRETEIMNLVVKGLRNKQIAGELEISEKTVKAHRGSAMRKVGARTVADLIHVSKTAAIDSPEY